MRAWLGLAACTLVFAGWADAQTQLRVPVWPAPKDPLTLARKAGLKPETHEFFLYHVHAHLDVFVDGKPLAVPPAIGIDITNPAVHRYVAPDGSPEFGGIDPPCKTPCISPLHTHAFDGIIHTESLRRHPNKLGQFFVEWNVRLTPRCVGGFCRPAVPIKIYVNVKPSTSDPSRIPLTNLKEIAIVIGRPPAHIPSHFPRG
jgi:hypothetical protein